MSPAVHDKLDATINDLKGKPETVNKRLRYKLDSSAVAASADGAAAIAGKIADGVACKNPHRLFRPSKTHEKQHKARGASQGPTINFRDAAGAGESVKEARTSERSSRAGLDMWYECESEGGAATVAALAASSLEAASTTSFTASPSERFAHLASNASARADDVVSPSWWCDPNTRVAPRSSAIRLNFFSCLRDLRGASKSKKRPPIVFSEGDDSYQGSEGTPTPQNAEIAQRLGFNIEPIDARPQTELEQRPHLVDVLVAKRARL